MTLTVIDGSRIWSASEVATLGVRPTSRDVLDDARQALKRVGRQWRASNLHKGHVTISLVPLEQPAPLGLSLTL